MVCLAYLSSSIRALNFEVSGGKSILTTYRAMNVVERLIAALQPDDVLIGGANVKKLKELPPDCRAETMPTPL